MADFSVVSRAKAPPAPVRQTARQMERMREYESFVRGIKRGQAGRLTPAASETARSVVVRIRRAATRVGVGLEAWVADGEVYFKLV